MFFSELCGTRTERVKRAHVQPPRVEVVFMQAQFSIIALIGIKYRNQAERNLVNFCSRYGWDRLLAVGQVVLLKELFDGFLRYLHSDH